MEIAGRTTVVTGAGGGLGRAITRELSRRGADLVITGRDPVRLEVLAAETAAEVLVADLCVEDDVARIAARVETADVLVANAGTGAEGDITETTTEDIDELLAVNLRAPMVLATAFAQAHLAGNRPGQIVLMGSLSALAATRNTRLYNATKFGLRGFALALRQDLEGSGIGVTIVEPGFVRDAGMFAEGDTKLPPGFRTRCAQDVADSVVTAIEKNPTEIFVAPFEHRLSATVATVAPGFTAEVQRRLVDRGFIEK